VIPAEEPAQPAGAGGWGVQTGPGVRGAVGLEPLPVVGKLAREEHLAGEERLGFANSGLGPKQSRSLVREELGKKCRSEMGEESAGDLLELLPVRGAIRVGSGASMMPAKLHHQPEARHFHGLLDALAELRLDALKEPSRVAVLLAERPVECALAHGAASIRASPRARGSGAMPRSR